MSKISVGIIGFGYWGKILFEKIKKSHDFTLDWIVDPLVLQDNFIKFNFLDLALKKNIPNLVIIATPASTHFSIAEQLISQNINCLITKPLCSNLNETISLIDKAKNSNIKIFTDHTFVYSNSFNYIKSELVNKKLGELQTINSIRMNLGKLQADTSVVMDLAVHDIALIDKLLNCEPLDIRVIGKKESNFNQYTTAHISLIYPDQVLCNILVSWFSASKMRDFTIHGTSGLIHWDDNDPINKINRKTYTIEGTKIIETDVEVSIEIRDSLDNELQEVFETLINNRLIDYDHNLRVAKTLDVIERKLNHA